ncbi:MAG: D-2-hydroxyacid dehydrogenase, partial [Smithellaceae bacterium]|nr:D-2-hydroxyacid dehydrogenase [Smithellaceae bacterium]
GWQLLKDKREGERLLIFGEDAKIYEEILTVRLPELKVMAAVNVGEAIPHIERAEIILSWRMPDELLRRAGNLRWFASQAAGNEHLVNNSNLPPEATLTKTTIYGGMMREYLFSYLLYFAREIPRYQQDQREKVWSPARPGRLRGKVMGILGLGAVGREIARGARYFGMTVLGINRSFAPVEDVDEVFSAADLHRMIPRLDYLVNVLPLTDETRGILGEKEFLLLREGAVFVNMGRGKTIDEEGLSRVLVRGNIRAVLDVFVTEPLAADSPLWDMDNVMITPHVSGINIPEDICENFIENYGRWRQGERLHGLVDRALGY